MNRTSSKLLIFCIILGYSCGEQPYPDPLSPEKSLESFKLPEGFKIEIFAAEPYVLDPVEMIFDEQGNAYVVEMPDYPYKPEPGKAEGRIRLLRDNNGDGRVDESTVFADKLMEATSILPWKGGLLVTTAPNILYLKDTTGDFQADTREVIFSGFFEDNSEAQITSLRFSIDNWIYAANHGQAGEVSFIRNPDAPPISVRGADFRFRLDRGQFELESGVAQFGHAIDDWGNRFMTQNTLHIRQAVIPWRYMHRHPYLPSMSAALNISDHELRMYQETPPPYWRAERSKRRNQQYQEQNLDRVEHAEDHFTGASGGTIYAGDAFPQEYYGNVFTGEVAGNLVHRDVLIPLDESPTFIAKRDDTEKDKEFLSSVDPWFRPASFTVGPDGYLYVIDMYRQHIETPLAIPEDLKKDMDFLNGSQHGRIYRILPDYADSQEKAAPGLKNREVQAYVELLGHPNQWWRLQAQRVLLERQDTSVIQAVKTLFTQHEDPRGRLHALYVLEGMNSLDAELVRQAMQDPNPNVRRHGMMLSEHFPELLPQLVESIDDPSIQVAFQASLSLGEFTGEEATTALAGIIERYGADPWFRTAVLSAEAGSSMGLIKNLAERGSFFREAESWKLTFLEDFSYVTGAGHQETQILAFLDLLSQPVMKKQESWQEAGLAGLMKGLKKAEVSDDQKESLQRIEATEGEKPTVVIQDLKNLYASSHP